MELNPNHPTTSTMHDHWHKIAAILVNRCPGAKTRVTLAEIHKMAQDELAITIKEVNDTIELQIIPMAQAQRLARREGGLPA